MAHYIDPRVWDDEKFLELDDGSRNLWLLLLTGPQRGRIPGLWRGTVQNLQDTLNRSLSDVELSMRRLEDEAMVIVNRRSRVICVPNAPKYTIPPNVNQLKGWWWEWTQEIPNCEQKIRHVLRLKEAVNFQNARMLRVWIDTFDRVIREQVAMDSSYAKFVVGSPEDKGNNVFSLLERQQRKTRTETKGAKRGKRGAAKATKRAQAPRLALGSDRDEIPEGW